MTMNDLMCQPVNVTRRSLVAAVLLAIVLLTGLCVLIPGCAKKSPTTFDDGDSAVVIFDPEDTVFWEQDSVYVVQIETTEDTWQGMHVLVDVTMNRNPFQSGGWDFLIGYDASALLFQAAIPGALHTECGWEYFNYRYGPFGNCDTLCPSGMLRVISIAETNNGPYHPDLACADNLGESGSYLVFTLDFLVSNDRTFERAFVPIRFFWMDCGDNSIAYHPPDDPMASIQGVSRYVFETPLLDEMIADDVAGFPTYTGVQQTCFENDPDKPMPVRIIDFVNGGVDIICADSIDGRGDVNLNGKANEIADAVLFSNYFVKGISVFMYNLQGQVAASDVNANGTPLEIADLVYLIRIITGDALPLAPVTPVPGRLTQSAGTLFIDRRAGAAYIVLEGDVAPQLLVSEMEISYAFDGRNTRVLVSKIEQDSHFEGQFLAFDANVLEAELATYDGAPIDLDGSYSGPLQSIENYPNPFSDTTTIRCVTSYPGAYTCTIFDVAGAEVAEFTGTSIGGLFSIRWDASDLPEGIYVCRVEVSGEVATHRMLLVR
ncbi:MAG: T9SS type A sorting domain-containing protein [candidate division Zixibacteria bacterium]|nr:T9SS type A sorting domain-containing protein [candidate division Zixibacteria bacterium]